MNDILINIIRFVALVFFQVTLFNHINLFNEVNPIIYILWVALFPIQKNKAPLLLSSFFMGLCIDMFSDSGGIHTASLLLVAFLRPVFLRISFRKSETDYASSPVNNASFSKLSYYLLLIIFIHHLTAFSLEYFSITHIGLILSSMLKTIPFTFVITLFIVTFLLKKRS